MLGRQQTAQVMTHHLNSHNKTKAQWKHLYYNTHTPHSHWDTPMTCPSFRRTHSAPCLVVEAVAAPVLGGAERDLQARRDGAQAAVHQVPQDPRTTLRGLGSVVPPAAAEQQVAARGPHTRAHAHTHTHSYFDIQDIIVVHIITVSYLVCMYRYWYIAAKRVQQCVVTVW